MKFEPLAHQFAKLEKTSSTDAMIRQLADAFGDASPDEVRRICYLAFGKVAPGYEDVNIGLGYELVKEAIALAADTPKKDVEKEARKKGDLGDVAKSLVKTRKKRFSDPLELSGDLSIADVHEGLLTIARAGGKGSQDVKKTALASLLVSARAVERVYITRLALATMRLGIGDMTVLDALATRYLSGKKDRPPLEHAYNVSSDLGDVGKVLASSGLAGVKRMRIALNRPLRPMLAQRVKEISAIREKMLSDDIGVEEKYDGERIQAHKDGDGVRLFSRRLNDVTGQFPDVAGQVRKHVDANKAILDGEVVAYDFDKKTYYPFQRLMERRRKYDVDEYAKKTPVKYMVFDLLSVNGSSLTRKSYPERRKRLEGIVSRRYKYLACAHRIIAQDTDAIDDYFNECLARGLEGVVCKSCAKTSHYQAGARKWSWIKWKKEYASQLSDSFDLVVVGGYAGKGQRAGTYGALLLAAYNKEDDIFQTLCKLGTGFTDEELENLPAKLKNVEVKKKPSRLQVSDDVKPHQWFRPTYVAEVIGAELTESGVHTAGRTKKAKRGLGLRFPRFKRWRPEKKPDQATTIAEIQNMHKRGSS